MAASADIAGLVLAGGQSSRFGSPKALAMLGGEMLVERMARLLGHACAKVAVSGNEALLGRYFLVLPDAPGVKSGPLAGVLAGLRWASRIGATWLVTAPCDTPLLPEDFAERLVTEAGMQGAEVSTFESGDGLHPLITAWRSSLLPKLESALASSHPPVHAFLESLRLARLSLRADQLINVNTPGDLERVKGIIARA